MRHVGEFACNTAKLDVNLHGEFYITNAGDAVLTWLDSYVAIILRNDPRIEHLHANEATVPKLEPLVGTPCVVLAVELPVVTLVGVSVTPADDVVVLGGITVTPAGEVVALGGITVTPAGEVVLLVGPSVVVAGVGDGVSVGGISLMQT